MGYPGLESSIILFGEGIQQFDIYSLYYISTPFKLSFWLVNFSKNTLCLLIFTSNCFAPTVHVCYCSNNQKLKRVYRCSPFRFYFTCSSFYISFYILIRGRHKIKTTDGLYSIQHFSHLDPRKRNTNFSDIGSCDFSYVLWYDICFYLKSNLSKNYFY